MVNVLCTSLHLTGCALAALPAALQCTFDPNDNKGNDILLTSTQRCWWKRLPFSGSATESCCQHEFTRASCQWLLPPSSSFAYLRLQVHSLQLVQPTLQPNAPALSRSQAGMMGTTPEAPALGRGKTPLLRRRPGLPLTNEAGKP